MGTTQSAELTPEDRAKWEAKQAQVSVLKEQLVRKVEEHRERLQGHREDVDGGGNNSNTRDHLHVFRDELMATVSEHTREMADMEAEHEQLKKFKSELLEKVGEHLNEIHEAEDKAKIVATFKDEMLAKVDEHYAAVGK